MNARERLKNHIAINYLQGDATGLDDATALLDLKIIDSVAIYDLLHYIRTELGVGVPMDEISPTNFASIANIVAMVDRLRARERRSS